jgi:hypothetical protein
VKRLCRRVLNRRSSHYGTAGGHPETARPVINESGSLCQRPEQHRRALVVRGWDRLAIVVIGALTSNLILAGLVRTKFGTFVLNVLAFLCLVGTQVTFWRFTYPANQQTHNWTVLPDQWQELRNQWEYSHATSAGLNLVALIALTLSVLAGDE